MPTPTEYPPGDMAPAPGIYVLLNVFGTPTETRIVVTSGARLPSAPRGHSWALAEHVAAGEHGPEG